MSVDGAGVGGNCGGGMVDHSNEERINWMLTTGMEKTGNGGDDERNYTFLRR